jgi:hypothetical protein
MTVRPTRLLALAATIASLMAVAIAGTPSASASSSPSGALHIAKECTQDTGLADSFCTITSSNIAAIPAGTRVVYFQAIDATGALNSDLALPVGIGNVALGHVDLPATGPGPVTLSGGTGTFARFTARAVVTCDPTGIFCNWDGTFRFGQDD